MTILEIMSFKRNRNFSKGVAVFTVSVALILQDAAEPSKDEQERRRVSHSCR